MLLRSRRGAGVSWGRKSLSAPWFFSRGRGLTLSPAVPDTPIFDRCPPARCYSGDAHGAVILLRIQMFFRMMLFRGSIWGGDSAPDPGVLPRDAIQGTHMGR